MEYMPTVQEQKNRSIDDIARDLALNKSTVSRAISGKGRVAEQTRARILAYIEQHGYRPSIVARGLALSKTYNIGVVTPVDAFESQVPFFLNCLYGVYEAASAYDYDIVLIPAKDRDAAPLTRVIVNRKVDALVLLRTVEQDESVRYLKAAGLPFVTIGRTAEENVLQVDTDHVAACRLLTERMLQKGGKRAALLLGSRDHTVNRLRSEGFSQAAEQAGVAVRIFAELAGRAAIEAAAEQALAFAPDALLCGDDYICDRALTYLERRGIALPVGTFFSSSLVDSHARAVPSVVIDAKALGQAAAGTLLHAIDERIAPPAEDTGSAYSIRG